MRETVLLPEYKYYMPFMLLVMWDSVATMKLRVTDSVDKATVLRFVKLPWVCSLLSLVMTSIGVVTPIWARKCGWEHQGLR